jgi:hypothetical protein
MLDKALNTNLGIMPPIDKKCVLDVPEFREPNFNAVSIQKRIDELDIEIDEIRHSAFVHKSHYGTGICGGVDEIDLLAKIAIRDSLIENMKTEKLR